MTNNVLSDTLVKFLANSIFAILFLSKTIFFNVLISISALVFRIKILNKTLTNNFYNKPEYSLSVEVPIGFLHVNKYEMIVQS